MKYIVVATGAGDYAIRRVMPNDYRHDIASADEREAILAWQKRECDRTSAIARRLLQRVTGHR